MGTKKLLKLLLTNTKYCYQANGAWYLDINMVIKDQKIGKKIARLAEKEITKNAIKGN